MKQHLQNVWKRRWLRRVLALVVVLAVLGTAAFFWLRRRAAVPVALMQSGLVRTTRLQKTSLDDAVTVTGTVQSGTTSTVTTDQKYAVKEILVQVGDTVLAGDVICTLDTSELEDSIEKAKKNQTEQAESAASQVSSATDSLNTANADAAAQQAVEQARQQLDQLEEKATQATQQLETSQDSADKAG